MSVTVLIITRARPREECLRALKTQGPHDLLISAVVPTPPPSGVGPLEHKYRHCSAHRDQLRRMALLRDSTHYLFLDDDIVLPDRALQRLLQADKEVVGGWYPMRGDLGKWVCGRFGTDGSVRNFTMVQPGLIKAGFLGAGCMLLTRRATEKLSFRHGTDDFRNNEKGDMTALGECGAFGVDAARAGIVLYMEGSVVCKHLM